MTKYSSSIVVGDAVNGKQTTFREEFLLFQASALAYVTGMSTSDIPSFRPLRRRWLQYSLRSLLVIMTLAAIACCLLFRVWTVRTYFDSGAAKSELQVRLTTQGWVFYGEQTWFYGTGQRMFRRTVYGWPFDRNERLREYWMLDFSDRSTRWDDISLGVAAFWAPNGRQIAQHEMEDIHPSADWRFRSSLVMSPSFVFPERPNEPPTESPLKRFVERGEEAPKRNAIPASP